MERRARTVEFAPFTEETKQMKDEPFTEETKKEEEKKSKLEKKTFESPIIVIKGKGGKTKLTNTYKM